MAELTTILTLTGHDDPIIAWAAQRALQIVQNRHIGAISPNEAVEALRTLVQQTDWSISDSDPNDRVLIDDAIENLILVVSAV